MIHANRWKNRFGLSFVSSLISNLVLSLISLLVFINPARSEITVVDDAAHTVRLSTTAKRVVSLAPHITELLFAAGTGHTDGTPVNRTGPRVIQGATQLSEKIEMTRDHLHIR